MMMQAKMGWTGGLKFEGTSAFGHKIATDASKGAGGQEDGYKPTELLLFGMAGCAGIDIVRILQKQKQKLTSLEIEMTAHQNDDYPRPFHTVEIKFIVRGDNLDEKKLAMAIDLSESKYCVVSQTVANRTKVTTSYEVLAN
ncbi:MAG: OsmC family protein [Candidatus Zixiibacteriota bacterium]|nr:MAG: OsmC family protein [candidate division Zixibacteria bacterium]